jgi:glyoxylate/hydroxypyruvate reductase A
MNILLCGEFEASELHDWQQSLRAALPEARWLNRDQARAVADTVEVAVVANPPPGSLQGLPRLRLIQSLWAGVDRLLHDPTLPAGVPVARMVDPAMNASMAETALWATLALQRGFFGYAQRQREHRWQPQPLRRASELRVLMLGLGQMGLSAARRIAPQGYALSAWTLHPRPAPPDLPAMDCRAGAAALFELLPQADVVVNLLPLTPATHGLLDARAFAALPRGAGIVNLARGAHLVEADLLSALQTAQVGHAVLDVFHEEPLPPDHPFWSHPRVTVLPHVAAQTDPRSASLVVAQNVQSLLAGRPLAHLVRPDRGY